MTRKLEREFFNAALKEGNEMAFTATTENEKLGK